MKSTYLILAVMATANAGTFNTGVNGSGNPLGINTADSHFTVNGPGTTPLTVVTIPFNPGYFVSGGNSIGTATASWITTNTNGVVDTLTGLYTYSEAITNAGFGGGLFSYSGNWATDNCGSILMNGSAVAGSGTTIGGGANAGCNGNIVANFQTLTPFSFTLSLGAGVNNLQFQVYNAGNGPTGLLVDSGAQGGVPEPSSILLTLTGAGLLAFGIRRRQATK